VLRGHSELRHFFTEGAKRRPNDLVRWYRTGEWLTDGHRLLIWEYPREAPDGDQVDLVEVMEIAGGKIRRHRIYWGWKGCALIAPALSRQTTAQKCGEWYFSDEPKLAVGRCHFGGSRQTSSMTS
jgi:hypothetical protein